MYKIGLTGSIGSGKSTASKYISKSGYIVLDADEISRELTAPGSIITEELVEYFSQDILDESGNLDRKKLAIIAFSSEENTKVLTDIVTLKVKDIMMSKVQELKADGIDVAFLDIPLLFEFDMEDDLDEVWTIVCDDEIRYARVKARDGLSLEEFKLRDNRQLNQEEKIKRSDVVFYNEKEREDLEAEMERELERIANMLSNNSPH